MYAIAFDLVVADTEQNHPKGVSQAYADIASILNEHGFRRVQGNLYVTDKEDMAKLFCLHAITEISTMVSKVAPRHSCFQNRAMV